MKVRKLYLATILTCTFALMSLLSMPLARAAEYVPFKATCAKGSAVAVSGPPILEIYITGSGKATHMGAVSIWQHHYVNLTDMTFYEALTFGRQLTATQSMAGTMGITFQRQKDSRSTACSPSMAGQENVSMLKEEE